YCHHPIEEMIHDVLKARAPDVAEGAVKGTLGVAQHKLIVERVGEFALMARNLFLDAHKWRISFCVTARTLIVMKREHIREEERVLFRAALDHLTPEDWHAVDCVAAAANAAWNDDP